MPQLKDVSGQHRGCDHGRGGVLYLQDGSGIRHGPGCFSQQTGYGDVGSSAGLWFFQGAGDQGSQYGPECRFRKNAEARSEAQSGHDHRGDIRRDRDGQKLLLLSQGRGFDKEVGENIKTTPTFI